MSREKRLNSVRSSSCTEASAPSAAGVCREHAVPVQRLGHALCLLAGALVGSSGSAHLDVADYLRCVVARACTAWIYVRAQRFLSRRVTYE